MKCTKWDKQRIRNGGTVVGKAACQVRKVRCKLVDLDRSHFRVNNAVSQGKQGVGGPVCLEHEVGDRSSEGLKWQTWFQDVVFIGRRTIK